MLKMTDDERRIQELESAIRRLLDVDFSVPSELDGDASCFYCSAYLQGGEDHEDDCPYMQAKKLIE